MRVRAAGDSATIRNARRTLSRTTATGAADPGEAPARFRAGEAGAIAPGRETPRRLLPRLPGASIPDGYFHAAGMAAMVPRGHAAALDIFSRRIEAMKADGAMRRVSDAHGMAGSAAAPPGSRC